MSQAYKLISYIIVIMILSSCNKEPTFPSLNITGYSSDNEYGQTNIKSCSMYLFMGSETYPNIVNPIKIIADSILRYPKIPVEVPGKLYVFSPFDNEPNASQIPMSTETQTDYLATQLPQDISIENHEVTLKMKHILSKVIVTVNGSDSCKVRIREMIHKGKYNLLLDQITLSEESGIISSPNSSIMIFPSYMSLQMEIEFNNKIYKYNSNKQNFESGKIYIFNLELGPSNELRINGNINIEEWQWGGDFNGSIQENK